MKNQIIKLEEKNRKVFGFDDEQVILSSKDHKTFESLQNASIKSGLMESITSIPVKDISELNYNEKNIVFIIKYLKKGKTKKTSIQLKDESLRDDISKSIAEMKDFEKSTITESKTKPLLINIVGMIAIAGFSWIFRGMAIDAQNGEHYVATGRNSGLKQLMAYAVEALGPTGVLAVGVLGIIYLLYVAIKRFSNPALDITYK